MRELVWRQRISKLRNKGVVLFIMFVITRYKKEVEETRKHEKLNHPGSKQQMEEVWEEEDGLEKDQFDPRTFFHLHG